MRISRAPQGQSVLSTERTPRNPRCSKEFDRVLGKRIRSRRREIGMSQKRLAKLLGVTFQQVAKYETGQNRISASSLVAVADALSWSAATFYEQLPASNVPRGYIDSEILTSEEGRDLAIQFLLIKDKAIRRKILALAKAIAAE